MSRNVKIGQNKIFEKLATSGIDLRDIFLVDKKLLTTNKRQRLFYRINICVMFLFYISG